MVLPSSLWSLSKALSHIMFVYGSIAYARKPEVVQLEPPLLVPMLTALNGSGFRGYLYVMSESALLQIA